MLLADLGAEVVKVEPPEGDATRGWGPPWVGDEAAGTRTAAYYLAVNRNKRSIRLDLRAGGGREALTPAAPHQRRARGELPGRRPGPAGLRRRDAGGLNPGLVHLAISGFGPDGPDAAKPGYDFVVQAVGGLMSITGAPDADGGRPTKVGVAISDVVTGLFGAVSVLAALVGRGRAPRGDAARRASGSTLSLLESTLAILVNQAQNAFVTGTAPGPARQRPPQHRPVPGVRDGRRRARPRGRQRAPVAAACARRWTSRRSPPTRGSRPTATGSSTGDALVPILAARFRERADGRLARPALDAAEVPCGPINDVAAAFATPQARARGMTVDLVHPALGTVRQAGVPFALSATPATIRTPPPLAGEHTLEILGELGYAATRSPGCWRRVPRPESRTRVRRRPPGEATAGEAGRGG